MNLMLDNFHTPPLSTTIQKVADYLVFHKIICRFCDLPVLTCYGCRLSRLEQFWSPGSSLFRIKFFLLLLRLLVDGNEFVHCIFLHVKCDDCGSLSIFSCLRKNNSFTQTYSLITSLSLSSWSCYHNYRNLVPLEVFTDEKIFFYISVLLSSRSFSC